MIRLLYLTHRWVGVALALFMLLWFSSGLIIAYSGSIVTTPQQRLAHAEVLHPESAWLSLGEAIEASKTARLKEGKPDAAANRMDHAQRELSADAANEIIDGRLVRVDGQPFWRLEDASGRRFAVSALDGQVASFAPEAATHIVTQWLASDADLPQARPDVVYVDTFETSTVLRNYQKYKPFHRVAVKDGQGTELIVSARTGEILQAATTLQRGLYYAGNFTHLFRPLDLLQSGELRRNTLLWAGLFAFVAALTGMVIGWLRWKPGFFGKPTYSKGRTQPYREFYLCYHFWSGLIGGTFSVLWAFSGALSTNPLQIFSEATANREELARFRGNSWPSIITSQALDLTPELDGIVKEAGWSHIGDQAQLIVYRGDGTRLALGGEFPDADLDKNTLLDAARRFGGTQAVADSTLLTDYDSYYYPNRRQGLLDKPLPVLRIDLADASHTSLYVDPKDGRLISKIDSGRRTYRWLYTALHHWDFGWLKQRPVWYVWMALWIGFGLVLSISSVVLGWRRLRRTIPIRAAVPQALPDTPVVATPTVAREGAI